MPRTKHCLCALPQSVPAAARKERVEETLTELGLAKVQNTFVGVRRQTRELARGRGGEGGARRQTASAVRLVQSIEMRCTPWPRFSRQCCFARNIGAAL